MLLQRSIEPRVRTVMLDYHKMAFVSGPRQVGKTTSAKSLIAGVGQGCYWNWDVATDQKRLAADPYFFAHLDRDLRGPYLVALDEIHKYRRWKSYLKGAFDAHGSDYAFLVTGSGRLDLFSRGGDSLMGRYFSVPLYPLTVGELVRSSGTYAAFARAIADPPSETPEARDAFLGLTDLNGFPEPFMRSSRKFLTVWAADRARLLVREDIRDATSIRQLSLVEMLSRLVPERVGGPLSITSLREDLGVAFETAREWLDVLHQFYYTFPVHPHSASLTRALRKETKVYLYDWSEVPEPGPRFENIVALHLLKAAALWSAAGEGRFGLRYIRDKEKREVDFVVTERDKPVCLIECKLSDTSVSPHLAYYQEKLRVRHAVQIVSVPGICRTTRTAAGTIRVISAHRFLSALP